MQGLNEDAAAFQAAVGEKLGNFLNMGSIFVAGDCTWDQSPSTVYKAEVTEECDLWGWGRRAGPSDTCPSGSRTGTAIAFWRGWDLTLVYLSAIPALVGMGKDSVDAARKAEQHRHSAPSSQVTIAAATQVIVSALVGFMASRLEAKSSATYAAAGAIAQDALSNIRTGTWAAALGTACRPLCCYSAVAGLGCSVQPSWLKSCFCPPIPSCSCQPEL